MNIHPGQRVRVREGHRTGHLATVVGRYNPDYQGWGERIPFTVRFDDGRTHDFYWDYLTPVESNPFLESVYSYLEKER